MTKPNAVKKVEVRAPVNQSALAQVFSNVPGGGNPLQDDKDPAKRNEPDDEPLQYTEQEANARNEREQAKARAQRVLAVIQPINEKNREILALGQPMVATPAADRYGEEAMLDAEQHDDAMKRLPVERQAVDKGLLEAKKKAEEKGQGTQRAKEVQARLDKVKKQKRQIVDVWQGKLPVTPCTDQYDGKATLSQKEHADALARLSGEEAAVQKALDQAIKAADAKGAQWAKERDEGQARAKTAQRQIFDLSDLYSRVSNLADKLGIEAAEGPYHDEVAAETLSQTQFDKLQQVLTQEKNSLSAWLPLLQPAASWSPDELINRENEAETAYTSVQNALRSDKLLTQAPPGGVKGWIGQLATHRLQQRTALDLAALRDAMRVFYNGLNTGKKVPEKVHKQLMERFAADYAYKADQWETYKRIYQEYAKADKVVAVAPLDGRLTRDKLRGVLPSGNTAGQWYTVDKTFDSGDGGEPYEYHLSVAFSITAKKGVPDMATITSAHVSFKRGAQDRKCWYGINKGTFSNNGTSGKPLPDGAMKTRADTLLKGIAKRLNCTF